MTLSASIIIPAHNEETFLVGLLASLKKYLAQQPQIIVVNNGSTDHTSMIAQRYGCQVIETEKKKYPSVARNIGAQEASGDVLIFLDADVEITQSWALGLESILNKNHPSAYFITGDQYHISKQSSWVEQNWFSPLRSSPKTYINGGNIIISKALFQKISGFNGALETGEDVDFCERAARTGASFTFDDNLEVYHEGFPQSMTDFLRRERWHGKGDFQAFNYFIKSKVAILTVIFLSVHMFLLLCLPFTLTDANEVAILIAVFSVITILSLCILSAFLKLGSYGLKYIIPGTIISYVYFIGRSLSLFDMFREKYSRFLRKIHE